MQFSSFSDTSFDGRSDMFFLSIVEILKFPLFYSSALMNSLACCRIFVSSTAISH